MEMEKYLITIDADLDYLTTSYILETVSFYGVQSHLYSLAAIFERTGSKIMDGIQNGRLVIEINNRSIIYTASKI